MKGKEFFDERDYSRAEEALKTCLAAAPNDTDSLISLASVQMKLGNFTESENNFKAAARLLPPDSPYIAYVNSLLGDIATRKPDLKAAAFFYDAALRVEPANINALVGKGVTEEFAGRTREAAVYFKRALAVDFTNIAARERLIALEPDILDNNELLLMLKERNIIDPAALNFTRADEDLLRKIIILEKDSGIEYLTSKYGGALPKGFVVERNSGKIYVRKMLTYVGYKDLIAQLSRDAKQFLVGKGVSPGSIFKLRDYNGRDIFDAEGNLTDEGMAAYTKSLDGQKAYFLQGEITPATQAEIDRLAKAYLKRGYSEITFPAEFLYLLRHTRCSEETLVKDVYVRVINIDSEHKRVFVVSDPNLARVPEIPASLPLGYILDYRQSYHERKRGGGAPVQSSSPFGRGGGVELKLCNKDGTILGDSLKDLARQAKENAAARGR
ncbi:MAG: tetratricopeptide repeat protein [Elusimicrobiota bacterium]|jgi:tetratricopeptide (TPR) repeat protein|nr:tetratricopeptide repeat protein [Elusimicrobiota bacterium]